MTEPKRLAQVSQDFETLLTRGTPPSKPFSASDIDRRTEFVIMRDGVRLATDLYLPPKLPAPAIVLRTPYGRVKMILPETFLSFAQHGYVAISQDCRGTGDSEPDSWDYYVFEREDSLDFVEWVTRQEWYDGFIGSIGGSYCAETQFCMGMHPKMSAILPEVGGLGIAYNTVHFYMFLNAYSRSVGKGEDKEPIGFDVMEQRMLPETLAGGYFNEPLDKPFSEALLGRYPYLRTLSPDKARRWLWENYCVLPPQGRAEIVKLARGVKNVASTDLEAMSSVFGQEISHDANMFPTDRTVELVRSLRAVPLLNTGWYDWGLIDALVTWEWLQREAPEPIRSNSRLIITPSAHNKPGYHEGKAEFPELKRDYRTADITDLLLQWYDTVRANKISTWPKVMYYLMGANEWYAATSWPLTENKTSMYLGSDNALTFSPPKSSEPDSYTYDPQDPTPTVGGSIVSYVYPPGSADVSAVQKRPDVLTYTTPPLDQSIDVVGPLRLILYASSSAVDTDFSARLSDVFPDGRAIQLQSGFLRARYRNLPGEPELMRPGHVYKLEIDMWATANRFKEGHSLRLDISSADFPKFDRNSGSINGPPVRALQKIYHDPQNPSHIVISKLG